MCIQVIEIHAVCGCIYYSHGVDPCPKAGTKGHQVSKRRVSVGYNCLLHGKPSSASLSNLRNLRRRTSTGSLRGRRRESPQSKASSRGRSRSPPEATSDKEDYLRPDAKVEKSETPHSGQQFIDDKANHSRVQLVPPLPAGHRDDYPNKSLLADWAVRPRTHEFQALGIPYRRRDYRNLIRAIELEMEQGFTPLREQMEELNQESIPLQRQTEELNQEYIPLQKLRQKPIQWPKLIEWTSPLLKRNQEYIPLQKQMEELNKFKNDAYILPSLLFSATLTSVNLFALTLSLQVWLQILGIHLLNFLGISYFLWLLTFYTKFSFGWKQLLGGYYRRLFRPKLQKGWTRLEWTCSCGDVLYGDFVEMTPGSLSKLARILRGQIIGGSATEGDVSDCTEGFGRQACSGKPQATPSQASLVKTSASNRGFPIQQENEPTAPKLAVDLATTAHGEVNRKRWLELCIKSGRNTFNLGEVDLLGAQDDQTVFTKIKEKYAQNRQTSWFGSWSLRVPSGGIFVELRKDKLISGDQVPTACIMKRNSIPTPEEAALYKYTFCPMPMDEPPMDSQTFYHYFSKPHAAEAISVWTTRFPKLDDASLYYSAEILAKGWGIEITEELNWTLFLVISLIVLLLSGLIAGISAYLMDDRSTGVAIGAWLSAVQSLATAALFFHWSRS